MSLVNKLSLLMAKIGCAGLRNTSEENKDNLRYVKAVVKSQGPKSFQFASDFIRSDAESLLEMVSVNAEILRFANKQIIDRYVNEDMLEENEVNYLIFALKCLEIDVNSILYFDRPLQKTVLKTLKTQNAVVGEFSGKPCIIDVAKFRKDGYLQDIIYDLEKYKRYEVL